MASTDDWSWDGMLMATEDISIDDELRGTGEVHLSKKTSKVSPKRALELASRINKIDK
jgi:hypothetical protein